MLYIPDMLKPRAILLLYSRVSQQVWLSPDQV